MTRRSLLVFCLTLPALVWGIQTEERLQIGKLDNGLTYYVQEHPFPQGRASLRLVVKVGSAYEEEEERGIAHFVEHMVFRGTERFADGEISRYLESVGAWSGTDANASTSFEETRYQIDVPLKKEGVLRTSLAMLSEMAQKAVFSPAILDKERHVVLDEILHEDADKRLDIVTLNLALAGTAYEERAPAGLPQVIETASADLLKRFYKKWYRPDRMALIAVGDFQGMEVVRMIEELFGSLMNPEEEVEEIDFYFTPLKEPVALSCFDPELEHTMGRLVLFYPAEESDLPEEEMLKQAIFSQGAIEMFNRRLQKRVHEEGNLLAAEAGTGLFSGSTCYVSMAALFYEESCAEGMKEVYREYAKMLARGFAKGEWEAIRGPLRIGLEQRLANLDKIDSVDYAEEYADQFMSGSALFSKEWFYRSLIALIDKISVEEINQYLPNSPSAMPPVVIFSTPSLEAYQALRQEELTALLEETPLFYEPEDKKNLAWQFDTHIGEGAIQEIKTYPGTPITEWIFENQVHLFLAPTDLQQGEVTLFAQAKGGLASFPEEEGHSAALATLYARLSGLNGFSYVDLEEALQMKGIDVTFSARGGRRYLKFDAISPELESAFQYLHAFFSRPHFDPKVWDRLIARESEYTKNMQKDPNRSFEDFLDEVNSQNHFYFQRIDLHRAQEELARLQFERLFGHADEFTFFLVGDFDLEKVSKMATTYIGSLPRRNKEPFPPLLAPHFPKHIIYRDLAKGQNAYATTVVTFPYDLKGAFAEFRNMVPLSAAAKILEQRLTALLREEMGGTYNVSVDLSTPFYPDPSHATLQIRWTTDPTLKATLTRLTLQAIDQFKNSSPTAEELATIQTLFLESKKSEKLSNSYWIRVLSSANWSGLPLVEVLDYERPIQSLTSAKLQKAASYLFSSPHYTVLSHVPEQE